MTQKAFHPSSRNYDNSLTIADGQTLSGAFNLEGMELAGLFIPAGFEGTQLYIQAATAEDGSFGRIKADGNDFVLSVAAGQPVSLTNLAILAAWQFIKLEAATSQTGNAIIPLALRVV